MLLRVLAVLSCARSAVVNDHDDWWKCMIDLREWWKGNGMVKSWRIRLYGASEFATLPLIDPSFTR